MQPTLNSPRLLLLSRRRPRPRLHRLARVANAKGDTQTAKAQAEKSLQIFETLGHYRVNDLKELIKTLEP